MGTLKENIPQDFPWYDREKKIEYSNALCLLTERQLNQNNKKMSDKLCRPTMSFLKLTLLILII